MITRIEIDGFKSFLDFELDIPPFLAVIGRNAGGKSNLLDAFAFVAAVARGERLSAAVEVARGDAMSLFHRRADGEAVQRMTFALEFLLDGHAEDLPSAGAETDHELATRWRYACELGWVDRRDRRTLAVFNESFTPIDVDRDRWPVLFPMSAAWRAQHVRYWGGSVADRPLPVPATRNASQLRGDSNLPDREPRVRSFSDEPSARLAADVCAGELADLVVLRLEPRDLMRPSPLNVDVPMASSGRGIAGHLQRMHETTATEDDPLGVLADVVADLVRVVPDVTGFQLTPDEERGDVRLRFETRNDRLFEAVQASDGTLRVLGILTELHNPARRGALAIEEPENGVFPQRFGALLHVIGQRATDPLGDDPSWPLRQVLVTSHSPMLLDAVDRSRIVFLETVSHHNGGGQAPSRLTRPRRLAGTGERPVRDDTKMPPLSDHELNTLLSRSAGHP